MTTPRNRFRTLPTLLPRKIRTPRESYRPNLVNVVGKGQRVYSAKPRGSYRPRLNLATGKRAFLYPSKSL